MEIGKACFSYKGKFLVRNTQTCTLFLEEEKTLANSLLYTQITFIGDFVSNSKSQNKIEAQLLELEGLRGRASKIW